MVKALASALPGHPPVPPCPLAQSKNLPMNLKSACEPGGSGGARTSPLPAALPSRHQAGSPVWEASSTAVSPRSLKRALRGSPGGSAAGNRGAQPCPPAASTVLAPLPPPARLELGLTAGSTIQKLSMDPADWEGAGEGEGRDGDAEAPGQWPRLLTYHLVHIHDGGCRGAPRPWRSRGPRTLLPAN